MSFTDRTLSCVDCGAEFVFSGEDQEFHASRGFTNEPKRCPDCRRARKSARGDAPGGGGGGGGYGGGGGGGGYSSAPRQMYPAQCAQCGRETEVPFQPRGNRPVYCRDCFRTMAPQGGGGGGGYGSGGGGNYGGGGGGNYGGGGGGNYGGGGRGGR